MENIMIDLETFSTRKDAVVVSIGAVGFDLGVGKSLELGAPFHIGVSILDQQKLGRVVDGSTLLWWLTQERAARESLGRRMAESAPLLQALFSLDQYVRDAGAKVKVWAKGANFDIALLESLFESVGMDKPWKYNHTRCTRSFDGFFTPEDDPPHGVGHDALFDARWQAQQLQNLYVRMGWTT